MHVTLATVLGSVRLHGIFRVTNKPEQTDSCRARARARARASPATGGSSPPAPSLKATGSVNIRREQFSASVRKQPSKLSMSRMGRDPTLSSQPSPSLAKAGFASMRQENTPRLADTLTTHRGPMQN